jgi:hypothetical protein
VRTIWVVAIADVDGAGANIAVVGRADDLNRRRSTVVSLRQSDERDICFFVAEDCSVAVIALWVFGRSMTLAFADGKSQRMVRSRLLLHGLESLAIEPDFLALVPADAKVKVCRRQDLNSGDKVCAGEGRHSCQDGPQGSRLARTVTSHRVLGEANEHNAIMSIQE